MKKLIIAGLLFSALGMTLQGQNDTETAIDAKISAATFVTQDLDKSAQFYTTYLAFRELGRRPMTGEASLGVYGLDGTDSLLYVTLVPAKATRENPLPGVSFIEIPRSGNSLLTIDAQRTPISSELILAFRVEGLQKIHDLMKTNDVPVITPLAKSPSGKSTTLTVMDPNGIRVYMYEYNP